MPMDVSTNVYWCSNIGDIRFFCENLFSFIAYDFDFLFVEEFAFIESVDVLVEIS